MRRRRAATAADHIQESSGGEFFENFGHIFRRFIVFAEGIRQPGIRMQADMSVGNPREFLDIGPQIFGAERAVQTDENRFRVPNRIPEGFGRLPGEGAATAIGNGPRNHHWQPPRMRFEILFERKNCGFSVQRIENRFDQQQISATFH